MNDTKISYAVTVCNEFVEIQRLIDFLLKNKRSQDEIVVLFDSKNGDINIERYLRSHSVNNEFQWHVSEFANHFADWKNRLTSLCSGDMIFQIDADEMIPITLINVLPEIFATNPGVDMYLVPRINTVSGLTDAHIQKWCWNVNSKGHVNFPDYQSRIYRNNHVIRWTNKVHETLEKFDMYSALPAIEDFCIIHEKTIERQEKQNDRYDTI